MNELLHEIWKWRERAAQAGWCVATLAANCGVSLATLERHFHEHLGQCPHEWLHHDRMRRAQELLGAGSNVQETADQLGYNHQQNFSLAFKRYFGYPPSHLRKTEDGRRKTEDGRRKTEDGRRKAPGDKGGTLIRDDYSYRFPFAFGPGHVVSWRANRTGVQMSRLGKSLKRKRLTHFCMFLFAAVFGYSQTFGKDAEVQASLIGKPVTEGGFEVTGEFQGIVYGDKGEIIQSFDGYFVVAVAGCKWRIRTRRTDESLDYFEAGSADRTSIHLLGSHTSATAALLAESSNAENHRADQEVAFGQVQLGEVPHFSNAEPICLLWLAYSSGCYFASRTNNQIEPVYWFGGQPFFDDRLTLPAEWSLHEQPPHLPSRVVYFNDGLIRGIGQDGMAKTFPNQEPYSGGFTNAIYQVISYAQIGKHTLPAEFSLLLYRPKPDGKSRSEVIATRAFTFRITSSHPIEPAEQFIPTIPGVTSVKDRRFLETIGSDYNYVITNRWPAIVEIQGNPRYKATVMMRAKQNESKAGKTKTYSTVAVLIVISLISAAVLLRSTRTHPKPSNL
jgi:AraC-like DNA-binding protein